MIHLFKRLLGNRGSVPNPSGGSSLDSIPGPDVLPPFPRATDCYFFTSCGMQYAVSKCDFERAANLGRESLQYLAGFVNETCNAYGTFDIRSIPPLEQGGRILALLGDGEGLSQLEHVVNEIPELEPWKAKPAEHWEDLHLFRHIEAAVRCNPYCLQTDIRHLVGHHNGHRVATLISYLEKYHKIQRFPEGKNYRLVCSDSVYGPPWEPPVPRESKRPTTTKPQSTEGMRVAAW